MNAIAALSMGGVALFAGQALAETRAKPPTWRATVSTESRYYSWDRRIEGSPAKFGGYQWQMPMTLQVSGRPSSTWSTSFLLRTAYTSSHQTSPTRRGDLSTFTDAVLTGTATYYGWKGFQPYASLYLNIPTGPSVLFGSRANARMDYDLVGVPTFGEGWNVGPSLGIAVLVNKALTFNFGGSYTYRGPYRREGAIDPLTLIQATNRLQAGDALSFDSSVGYNRDTYGLTGGLTYALSGGTSFNSVPYFRAGPSLTVSGSGWKKWSDHWSSSVSGYASATDKNKIVATGITALILEQFNSNSTSYRIGANTTFAPGTYSITASVARSYRTDNAWDPQTFEFVPEKGKWILGTSGSYRLSPSLGFTGRVERVFTQETRNPDKLNLANIVIPGSGVPPKAGRSWQTTIGINYAL